MAASTYSIVLNLGGNASRRVSKLATDLERANVAASSLARSLALVNGASQGIAPIRSYSTRRRPINYRSGSRGRPANVSDRPTNRSSHRRGNRNTMLSYGTGFNIGGFSGRLSSIMTPDANGNIMGMNAASLMKGANVAMLATTLVSTVAKAAAKTIAVATIAPIAVGGGILTTAIRALQSEGFESGVRLISRENQARLGMGEDYLQGQRSADFLASSYGFDRSTTLSSINVLSGMGVGNERKLSTSEATGLTKVGGLIAQQSGVSFERVMTNIQQLLVQTTPHVRDIREMLNQAPILGKYAMKDMEAKGVKGVDARTWLKDKNNIMSALKRYELDMATNEGMQARGKISLAQQDFWKTIASNNSFWRMTGQQGEGVIRSASGAFDTVMTSLANSDEYRVMVKHIETIFDSFAEQGGEFFTKLIGLVEDVGQMLGIDIGNKQEAREYVGKARAVQGVLASPLGAEALAAAEKGGIFDDYKGNAESMELAKARFLSQAEGALTGNEDYMESIEGRERARRRYNYMTVREGDLPFMTNVANYALTNFGVRDHNRKATSNAARLPEMDSIYRHQLPVRDTSTMEGLRVPTYEHAAYDVDKTGTMSVINDLIEEIQKAGGSIPLVDGGGEAEGGSSLTGFNRDRKALEIQFNAPIIEWTNTMEAGTPQETMELVAENIEELAAAGIQKALEGATNKMSTRWS